MVAMALRLAVAAAACCLAVAAADAGAQTAAQVAAVRDVFSRVLRLRPPAPPPAAPAHPPPRHMLELYRKYAAGAARRPHHGNTVRSILPDPELSSLDSTLVFNVSVVAAAFSAGGEEVRAAQLLLHGGRCWPAEPHHHHHHQHHHHQQHRSHHQGQPALPPLALAPPCRARLYRLHTAEPGGSRRRRRPLSLLSTLPLAPARAGWTSLEVSAPLRELLLGQGRALAVRFEAPGGRPMPPRAFLTDGADDRAAFLVVFSDDVDDENRLDDGGADGDGIGERGGSGGRQATEADAENFRPRHTHDMVEMLHAAGAAVFQPPGNAIATSSSSPVQTTAPPSWSRHTKHRLMLESNALEPNPETQHWRHQGSRLLVKRSIEDNELPESEAEDGEAAVSRLSPDLLLHARGTAAAHHGRDAADASSDVIPLPGSGHGSGKRGRGGGGGSGGGKRRRGRGRKHGRRARKRLQQEADWSENVAGSEVSGVAGNSSATCRRHRMAVNFADIGWADWIIAPEAFDAFFCAGRCPFPLPNSLGWTNHAFLQSLVRSLGQDEVPAPCCAPSALSDLTLLYNDNSVVVLRRFPKMSVLSCSCQ